MRTNVAVKAEPIFNHEGAKAAHLDPYRQLRRIVMSCMLFEDTFYEAGSETAANIAALVPQVDPGKVAGLAVEARTQMHLRHVPLFLIRELARVKGAGPQVAAALEVVIQRADELAEFLAIYWKAGKCPLSKGAQRGLATAFRKFTAYELAKYDRGNAVKLRDVLFMVHAKPYDAAQSFTLIGARRVPAIDKPKYHRGSVKRHSEGQGGLWQALIEKRLPTPDTWEVELSAGKDKKATFERLMSEGKLGGMALLRNLRNMQQAGVDDKMIRARLATGAAKALPFRFITAARYAPTLEDAIELAMFKAVDDIAKLPGKTGLLIDVSGSMDYALTSRDTSPWLNTEARAKNGETSRIDVAAGLAILLREKSDSMRVATFSNEVVEVPPRRGFALRDSISQSQSHGGTHLKAAINTLRAIWTDVDRFIVITDEQSQDGIADAWVSKSYLINVAPYKNGVGYNHGFVHIDGWSERILDYIQELEREEEAA